MKIMFCYQCQETMKGKGCTQKGMCGKKGEVADLQDDLIYVLKSIAFYNQKARKAKISENSNDKISVFSLNAHSL